MFERTFSLPLLFALAFSVLPKGENHSASNTQEADQHPDPRQILAHQPDYMGKEIVSMLEKRGGMSVAFNVAKKRNWYRWESDLVISFISAQGREVKYFKVPQRWEEKSPPEIKSGWTGETRFPEDLAKRDDVDIHLEGVENRSNYECWKIRVSSKSADKDLNGTVVFLYSAKALNGLVIGTDATLPDRRITTRIEQISLTVPDELFSRVLEK